MSLDLHDEEDRMEDCIYDLVGESHCVMSCSNSWTLLSLIVTSPS